MPEILFNGKHYSALPGETVLDCLLRAGEQVHHSCKSGVCQSCMMRAVEGWLPARAQQGLRDTLRAQNYFLACSCVPETDLSLTDIDSAGMSCAAIVESVQLLGPTVARVTVRPKNDFAYRPGQYANLIREDGLVRSYSLASVPERDDVLAFHVGLVANGRMSSWLHSEAAIGAEVRVQGPVGNCFYVDGNAGQPLFLAGTGTGLAPLYGIVVDALLKGHTGPIWLFHGAVQPEGLYLVEELRALANQHENLQYVPCVLKGNAEGVITAPLDDHSLATVTSLKGHKVYLCGHPDFVRKMQRRVFLSGAGLGDIYADAFLPSPS